MAVLIGPEALAMSEGDSPRGGVVVRVGVSVGGTDVFVGVGVSVGAVVSVGVFVGNGV